MMKISVNWSFIIPHALPIPEKLGIILDSLLSLLTPSAVLLQCVQNLTSKAIPLVQATIISQWTMTVVSQLVSLFYSFPPFKSLFHIKARQMVQNQIRSCHSFAQIPPKSSHSFRVFLKSLYDLTPYLSSLLLAQPFAAILASLLFHKHTKHPSQDFCTFLSCWVAFLLSNIMAC